MTRKIFKYPINMDGETVVKIHSDAKFLKCGVQHEGIVFWAVVETDNPLSDLIISTVETGQEVPFLNGHYMGTVLLLGGDLVLHVFWDNE